MIGQTYILMTYQVRSLPTHPAGSLLPRAVISGVGTDLTFVVFAERLWMLLILWRPLSVNLVGFLQVLLNYPNLADVDDQIGWPVHVLGVQV